MFYFTKVAGEAGETLIWASRISIMLIDRPMIVFMCG